MPSRATTAGLSSRRPSLRSLDVLSQAEIEVRAVVVDPSVPEAVRLRDVAEPVASSAQVVVDVHHVSLNYGDLNDAGSGRCRSASRTCRCDQSG